MVLRNTRNKKSKRRQQTKRNRKNKSARKSVKNQRKNLRGGGLKGRRERKAEDEAAAKKARLARQKAPVYGNENRQEAEKRAEQGVVIPIYRAEKPTNGRYNNNN